MVDILLFLFCSLMYPVFENPNKHHLLYILFLYTMLFSIHSFSAIINSSISKLARFFFLNRKYCQCSHCQTLEAMQLRQLLVHSFIIRHSSTNKPSLSSSVSFRARKQCAVEGKCHNRYAVCHTQQLE